MISVKVEIVIRVKLTLKYWLKKNYCLQTGSYVLDAQVTKVKDGVYHAMLEGKNVVFTFNETSIAINIENPQDKDALHFYCSDGASIAGAYTKITAPLDPSQMDKK
ncbi:hypothetical protein HHL23_02630 [Chryseobacterium sp. RP-3-3]|uniref:Uncharacterized protein n=1 Tax=Chryseobacterium antibioticum TaxID=2728847 RepID=A0A7Y0AJY4_9FLAO|nr:hypothetical protein [Chryseobacterium antibioticum]NML68696.1 hypothetical protein [Chryseobacterium antibioticum]